MSFAENLYRCSLNIEASSQTQILGELNRINLEYLDQRLDIFTLKGKLKGLIEKHEVLSPEDLPPGVPSINPRGLRLGDTDGEPWILFTFPDGSWFYCDLTAHKARYVGTDFMWSIFLDTLLREQEVTTTSVNI